MPGDYSGLAERLIANVSDSGLLANITANGTLEKLKEVDWQYVEEKLRDWATQDEIDQADAVDRHWVEYVKTVFIMIKLGFVCVLLAFAIIARRKKRGHLDVVSILLFCNIAVLIGMFFFEIGTKYIPAFYFMILIANFCNFLGCNMLFRRLPTPEGPVLKRRTQWYFWTMIALYVLCFAFGFTEALGPTCKSTQLYPFVLTFAEGLFVLNAAYHYYLHFFGYFLKWEEDPIVAAIVGKEHELGYEPVDIIKPMFKKQMDTYVCFQIILAVVCVAI